MVERAKERKERTHKQTKTCKMANRGSGKGNHKKISNHEVWRPVAGFSERYDKPSSSIHKEYFFVCENVNFWNNSVRGLF
jgi:hypothetical protein